MRLILLVLAALTLATPPAWACFPIYPKTSAERDNAVKQIFERSEYIFWGEIKKIEGALKAGNKVTLTVKASRFYKGSTEELIVFDYFHESHCNNIYPEIGQTMLFVIDKREDGSRFFAGTPAVKILEDNPILFTYYSYTY